MHRIFTTLLLLSAAILLAPGRAAAITMSWSPVGNPGNAADPSTGFGAVNYSYNIGTYDVTNIQYVAFLNSNDPTGANPLALYNSNMSDPTFGGINFDPGASSGQMYSIISGKGNRPVNYVTWYDAIRFANWMDNDQIGGDTETGAYTLLGDTPTPSNALSITRNAGATIFLPSENEWYKAAYYKPNPANPSYFLYPTSSNTPPTATGPTATPNSANFSGAASDNLTDVGAYTGTMSPYGAFDMGGDVSQWNEALISGDGFDLRGSAFNLVGANNLRSSNGNDDDEGGAEDLAIGFRLASVAGVPEPSTGVLAVFACGVALWWRKRK